MSDTWSVDGLCEFWSLHSAGKTAEEVAKLMECAVRASLAQAVRIALEANPDGSGREVRGEIAAAIAELGVKP